MSKILNIIFNYVRCNYIIVSVVEKSLLKVFFFLSDRRHCVCASMNFLPYVRVIYLLYAVPN